MKAELDQLRNALTLRGEMLDELMQRVGFACYRAHAAFAPFERKACELADGWDSMPEWVFDVESFELGGQSIQRRLNGACSLAAMVEFNPFSAVDKYERDAARFILKLADLAPQVGVQIHPDVLPDETERAALLEPEAEPA